MSQECIIQEQQGVTTITLPSQRKKGSLLFFSLLFLPLWLYMSSAMAYLGIIWLMALWRVGPLANEQIAVESPGFIAVVNAALLTMILYGYFLIFWSLYTRLWERAGKEIVEIDGGYLRIWRQIGKWKHAQRQFFCDQIQNPRVYQTPRRLFSLRPYLLTNHGKIVFDYKNRLVRFGLEADATDAAQIVLFLHKKLGID